MGYETILSSGIWWKIFNGFFKLIFAPYFLALVLSIFNRKKFKNKDILLFILFATLVICLLRLAFYFSGVISIRYMYPLVPLMLILSIPGFIYATKPLQKFIKDIRIRKIIICILLVLLCAGSIWKALHFRDKKTYLSLVSQDIINNISVNDPIAYISNLDIRPGYRVDINASIYFNNNIISKEIKEICKYEVKYKRKVFILWEGKTKSFDSSEYRKINTYNLKNSKTAYLYQFIGN